MTADELREAAEMLEWAVPFADIDAEARAAELAAMMRHEAEQAERRAEVVRILLRDDEVVQ